MLLMNVTIIERQLYIVLCKINDFSLIFANRNDTDVNISDIYGTVPLHIAILNHFCHLIDLLINSGSDVDKKNNIGNFALCMSAEIGDMKSAHTLLAADYLLHMCGKYTLIEKVRHELTSYVLLSHTLHMTILHISKYLECTQIDKCVYFSCKGI